MSCDHAWCHKTAEIEEAVRQLKGLRPGTKEWTEQRTKIDRLVGERAQIAQIEEHVRTIHEVLSEEGVKICRVTLEEKPN